MQFERKLVEVGGSLMLTIPPDLARFLQLRVGDDIVINEDSGKHGSFISLWKKGK